MEYVQVWVCLGVKTNIQQPAHFKSNGKKTIIQKHSYIIPNICL